MRIMLIAALAAATAPADRFDLVCKGERRWAKDGAAEPVEARYKVDMAAGRWCRDQCFEIAALAGAGAERLVFKAKPKAAGQDESYEEAVDASGANWVDSYEGPYPPGDYWRIAGACTVAPFTGLKP